MCIRDRYQIVAAQGDSTLAAAVGQNIVSNTEIKANSHLIRRGTTVQVTNDGGGLWLMSQFGGGHTQSLAANGWQRLPSGLIMQWGEMINVAHTARFTMTFPIAFPTAGLFATVIPVIFANINHQTAPLSENLTGTSFTSKNTTGITNNFRWFAVGH